MKKMEPDDCVKRLSLQILSGTDLYLLYRNAGKRYDDHCPRTAKHGYGLFVIIPEEGFDMEDLEERKQQGFSEKFLRTMLVCRAGGCRIIDFDEDVTEGQED